MNKREIEEFATPLVSGLDALHIAAVIGELGNHHLQWDEPVEVDGSRAAVQRQAVPEGSDRLLQVCAPIMSRLSDWLGKAHTTRFAFLVSTPVLKSASEFVYVHTYIRSTVIRSSQTTVCSEWCETGVVINSSNQ